MKLYINTASHSEIILELREGSRLIARHDFEAPHRQAEKLLPAIENVLSKNKQKLSAITEIIVEDKGLGFTALRIGITTANALSYALGIPISTPDKKKVRIAKPVYSREPSITKKKN